MKGIVQLDIVKHMSSCLSAPACLGPGVSDGSDPSSQQVKKRLALKDCQRNGWMLDGFPRTLQQARLMQVHTHTKKHTHKAYKLLSPYPLLNPPRSPLTRGFALPPPHQRAGIVPDVVLELDRPDEMVREWCLGRYHDAATGIIYHPKFNPPPPVRLLREMQTDDRRRSNRLGLIEVDLGLIHAFTRLVFTVPVSVRPPLSPLSCQVGA